MAKTKWIAHTNYYHNTIPVNLLPIMCQLSCVLTPIIKITMLNKVARLFQILITESNEVAEIYHSDYQ